MNEQPPAGPEPGMEAVTFGETEEARLAKTFWLVPPIPSRVTAAPPDPDLPKLTYTGGDGWIEMRVKTIATDKESEHPVMILTDRHERLYLPIWIGRFEAAAIIDEIEQRERKRPMTHDLFHAALTTLHAGVERVSIVDLQEQTYYARIVLRNGQATELDARPSDSVALALRFGAPIFVSANVLNRGAIPDKSKITEEERGSGVVRLD